MRFSYRSALCVLLALTCVAIRDASGGLFSPRGRVVVCPPSPCVAEVVPVPAVPAETAIRQVLDAQVAAWNKGDLESFMTGYWQSPELSFFSGGDKTRGWQATLERYRKRYQAEGQEMGKLTFSDLDIQLLGPDSAVVRGRFQLERSKDKPSGLFTLIFKRLPEGWRIVHDHTSSSN
jgi:beta-aspartyl-peptidase (threonine type)